MKDLYVVVETFLESNLGLVGLLIAAYWVAWLLYQHRAMRKELAALHGYIIYLRDNENHHKDRLSIRWDELWRELEPAIEDLFVANGEYYDGIRTLSDYSWQLSKQIERLGQVPCVSFPELPDAAELADVDLSGTYSATPERAAVERIISEFRPLFGKE